MRKLFFLLITVGICVFILDRIGGYIMGRLLETTKVPDLAKMNYMVNEMDEEVLLIGTSRTLYGLNPEIIEDSLDMRVFNCGISGGRNIFSHYMLLNYILMHYVPRIIVLEINKDDFVIDKRTYHYNKFSHLYGKNETCDSFMTEVRKDKGLTISHLYRYNVISKEMMVNLVSPFKVNLEKGFIKNKKNSRILFTDNPEMANYDKDKIDYNKLEVCKKFFELCEENGIKLILITLPQYSIVEDDYYIPVKELAQNYNLDFIDCHGEGLFLKDVKYFHDDAHLCEEGAAALSKMVAGYIKNHI